MDKKGQKKQTKKDEQKENKEEKEEMEEEEDGHKGDEKKDEEEDEKQNENDDVVEDVEQDYEDDDNYDTDDDYDLEDQQNLQELLLKQLMSLLKKNRKEETNAKKQFIPFLKILNLKEQAKIITDKHVFDFMRLSHTVIYKKIKINVSESYMDVLKELMSGMESDDRKL